MILIFGGTTEGRLAARLLDEAGKPYYYSTKGSLQDMEMVHGHQVCGTMDNVQMERFCIDNEIRLIVDAAHPFAMGLHFTISEVAQQIDIPVVRLERKFPPRDSRFVWCDDYSDAISQLQKHNVRHLLALSGVNTLLPMRPFWQAHECYFRILDREESREIAKEVGFPESHLLFYKQGEDDTETIRLHNPDAILTKESGESGYFSDKTEAALKMGCRVFVVKRPKMPENFYYVYGAEGLRKQIERLLPGFFPLRSGYTTGVCATVATKAALMSLLNMAGSSDIEITLPSGEPVTLPLNSSKRMDNRAIATVVKNSGDDPDVTNGAEITAEVTFSESETTLLPNVVIPLEKDFNLILCAGKGVGRVTLPGLGLEVGGPAINERPRQMIVSEIKKLIETHPEAYKNKRLTVTISVDGGEELALRTFNPKVGVEGGISIIGTSGIVRPFSHEAFVASIRKEMQVAKAIGCTKIIINSGAKSERFMKALYPDLPPQAFIHYGNYIGETLKIANTLKVENLVMGIMIGKAVKLAEGAVDTHSRNVVMNKTFICTMAREAHCAEDIVERIAQITLARELWNILLPQDSPSFYEALIGKCLKVCCPYFSEGCLEIRLVTEDGSIV